MANVRQGVGALIMMLIGSLFSIGIGIIYFGITLWIIKIASDFFFGTGLEANWAVLAAAIMSTGAVIAGGLERRRERHDVVERRY